MCLIDCASLPTPYYVTAIDTLNDTGVHSHSISEHQQIPVLWLLRLCVKAGWVNRSAFAMSTHAVESCLATLVLADVLL